MGAKTWLQHDCNARKKELLSDLRALPNGNELYGLFWVLHELWLEMQLHKAKPSDFFSINAHTFATEMKIRGPKVNRIIQIFGQVLGIEFQLSPRSVPTESGLSSNSVPTQSQLSLKITLPKSLQFIGNRFTPHIRDRDRERERDVPALLAYFNRYGRHNAKLFGHGIKFFTGHTGFRIVIK